MEFLFKIHTEWSSINLYDTSLHKSIRSDEFVVSRVIHDTDDTRLERDGYRKERKVGTIDVENKESKEKGGGKPERDIKMFSSP